MYLGDFLSCLELEENDIFRFWKKQLWRTTAPVFPSVHLSNLTNLRGRNMRGRASDLFVKFVSW